MSIKVTLQGELYVDRWVQQLIAKERDLLQKQLQTESTSDPEYNKKVFDTYKLINCYQQADITVLGSPDEDLDTGRVLLTIGPISIECDAEDLHKALKPYVG